jgi:flagellar FliL protein
MAKAAPPPAEGEVPKKKSKLLLIIIIAVLVLAAAGAGAFFLLKKGHGGEEGAAEPPKVEKKHKAEPGKPPSFINLEAFTVNLAPETGDQYLQLVIALKVDDDHAGDTIKNFMPEIRHRILMLLASKKASDLATETGRSDLADQLKDEVNGVVGTPGGFDKHGKKREAEGPVTAVLFTSFIVQ